MTIPRIALNITGGNGFAYFSTDLPVGYKNIAKSNNLNLGLRINDDGAGMAIVREFLSYFPDINTEGFAVAARIALRNCLLR